ncbi:MAG: helix-turn-helix domain-containing protein [Amphritea sp.]
MTNNSDFPFAEKAILQTLDICEAQEILNRNIEHRTFVPLGSSAEADILITSQQLQKTRLFAARWGMDISARSVELNAYNLIIPMSGTIYSRNSKTDVQPGEVIIFPSGSYTDLEWKNNARAIVISLDPLSMSEYFNFPGALPAKKNETIITAANSPAAGLINIINGIILDNTGSHSLLNSDRAQKHWEQLIFEALILCRPELEQITSHTVLPHSLKLAIEYIQENLHQCITMQDLVALTNTSRRSLESSFRNNFQTSPMKFVTRKKLEAVRQVLLKSHSEEATISEVAERFGFNHASHFSALYQRNYSEKPSDTLKQMP